MDTLAQLTTSELRKLTEHATALVAMRPRLPVELFLKLDTFLTDLRTEASDRAQTARQPGKIVRISQ